MPTGKMQRSSIKTDWDQLLANITQQTGLTFRKETQDDAGHED
jgi:Arc/MetJ family transcription regulator